MIDLFTAEVRFEAGSCLAARFHSYPSTLSRFSHSIHRFSLSPFLFAGSDTGSEHRTDTSHALCWLTGQEGFGGECSWWSCPVCLISKKGATEAAKGTSVYMSLSLLYSVFLCGMSHFKR